MFAFTPKWPVSMTPPHSPFTGNSVNVPAPTVAGTTVADEAAQLLSTAFTQEKTTSTVHGGLQVDGTCSEEILFFCSISIL